MEEEGTAGEDCGTPYTSQTSVVFGHNQNMVYKTFVIVLRRRLPFQNFKSEKISTRFQQSRGTVFTTLRPRAHVPQHFAALRWKRERKRARAAALEPREEVQCCAPLKNDLLMQRGSQIASMAQPAASEPGCCSSFCGGIWAKIKEGKVKTSARMVAFVGVVGMLACSIAVGLSTDCNISPGIIGIITSIFLIICEVRCVFCFCFHGCF